MPAGHVCHSLFRLLDSGGSRQQAVCHQRLCPVPESPSTCVTTAYRTSPNNRRCRPGRHRPTDRTEAPGRQILTQSSIISCTQQQNLNQLKTPRPQLRRWRESCAPQMLFKLLCVAVHRPTQRRTTLAPVWMGTWVWTGIFRGRASHHKSVALVRGYVWAARDGKSRSQFGSEVRRLAPFYRSSFQACRGGGGCGMRHAACGQLPL